MTLSDGRNYIGGGSPNLQTLLETVTKRQGQGAEEKWALAGQRSLGSNVWPLTRLWKDRVVPVMEDVDSVCVWPSGATYTMGDS